MAVQDLRRQETALSGPAKGPEKNATPPTSAWQRLRPEPGRSGRGDSIADFNRHPRRHFGGRRSAAASAIVRLGLERLQCRHGHRPIPLFRLPECHRTQHHADRHQGNQCPLGGRTPETARKSGHDRFSPGAGIETRPEKLRPQKAPRQTLSGTVAGNPTPVSPPHPRRQHRPKNLPFPHESWIEPDILGFHFSRPRAEPPPCSATSNRPVTAPLTS